ncbi:peptidylprolyl isomerase [Maribellus maritimus]|uniref:peptidylprolyl isomerase n=1 Tax=Maribellus maritimus TaxID=2870838 RepID=UPI001EEC5C98|nr:peptidylprolyl isomerase [Maribellus maritimus]MCG6191314.1 peptidylprolyl isomerase [Maribellus maritimus]
MNRFLLFITVTLIISLLSCANDTKKEDDLVLIKTDFGNIKVKLYSDTPKHKENFLKLANEGFYNGLLFHRVINHFMIQGGDPESKNAEAGARLGGGSPGYTVDAEFLPEKYSHKKGALAAARRGGPSNPEKQSSGSQFYIVHGEIFTPGKLDTMEMMISGKQKNEILKKCFEAANDELQKYRADNNPEGFNIRVAEIREEADSIFEASAEKFKFTDAQREAYTTIGGYPSLDGEYTVFGEVVEGLDVLDKIAAVETDKNNRPLTDIKMEMELVK